MPDCAAQPGCMRLVQAPSSRNSMLPAAMDSAMPCPLTSACGDSPISVPAASVQPKMPIRPVGWKPS